MKKILMLMLSIAFAGYTFAQELPDDVEKVYKGAEKLKSKGELTEAVNAYKEVLRSVDHVPSMESIGDIEMNMRKPPNYRTAYEYYDKAIKELDKQISAAPKQKDKGKLGQYREEIAPKCKKAKSFVDDFDNAKDLKQDGMRLMDEE